LGVYYNEIAKAPPQVNTENLPDSVSLDQVKQQLVGATAIVRYITREGTF